MVWFHDLEEKIVLATSMKSIAVKSKWAGWTKAHIEVSVLQVRKSSYNMHLIIWQLFYPHTNIYMHKQYIRRNRNLKLYNLLIYWYYQSIEQQIWDDLTEKVGTSEDSLNSTDQLHVNIKL